MTLFFSNNSFCFKIILSDVDTEALAFLSFSWGVGGLMFTWSFFFQSFDFQPFSIMMFYVCLYLLNSIVGFCFLKSSLIIFTFYPESSTHLYLFIFHFFVFIVIDFLLHLLAQLDLFLPLILCFLFVQIFLWFAFLLLCLSVWIDWVFLILFFSSTDWKYMHFIS